MGVTDDARRPAASARAESLPGPRQRGEAPSSGRALVWLTSALALGLLSLLVFVGEPPREAARVAPGHHDASASAQGGHMLALHPAQDGAQGEPVRTRGEPGLDAPVEARHRFDGRGSIRGELQVPRGLDPPAELTVVAAPSQTLKGRERARRSELRLAPGEREFRFDDLPLGGYDVRASGPGLDCRPVPVLLCEGSEHPYVVLGLRASGFVDGTVLDTADRPVEGALVTLEPLGAGERRETRTGPSGAYLLEDVPDGEYRLVVGPASKPLAEPLELSFRAPSLNVPIVRVPALAELEIEAVDASGAGLEDVHVSGFGSDGGQIEVATDVFGRAVARNLPPGEYRLSARHASGSARLRVEVGLERVNTARLVLRP